MNARPVGGQGWFISWQKSEPRAAHNERPLWGPGWENQYHIELIGLLTVASGLSIQSSKTAVQSCWIVSESGTHTCKRWSQACSIGDVPSVSAGHARTRMLSKSRCVKMGLCTIVLQYEMMVVDEWHNTGPLDCITVSLHSNKMHLDRSVSIPHLPVPHHSIHNVDKGKPLTHAVCHQLCTVKSSVKRTLLQISKCHQIHQICPLSYDKELHSGRHSDSEAEHVHELPYGSAENSLVV